MWRSRRAAGSIVAPLPRVSGREREGGKAGGFAGGHAEHAQHGLGELAAAAGILVGLWWHPLGLAAAAGMSLLLLGALITHRHAADSGREMAQALLALALTLAYLAIALTS
jgi:DoxX-like family